MRREPGAIRSSDKGSSSAGGYSQALRPQMYQSFSCRFPEDALEHRRTQMFAGVSGPARDARWPRFAHVKMGVRAQLRQVNCERLNPRKQFGQKQLVFADISALAG